MIKELLAPNGTTIYTQRDIEQVTHDSVIARAEIMMANDLVARMTRQREYGADDNGYAPPVSTSGVGQPMTNSFGPAGYGLGDSFRRTRKSTMEFSMPVGQADVMSMALEFAEHNVFIAKALDLKTNFTCTGLLNKTPSGPTNKFFDSVNKVLSLIDLYKTCVHDYYTVGLCVILFPGPFEPFTFATRLDPRQCRVVKMFGSKATFIVPDKEMIDACRDPNGRSNPVNAIKFQMIPPKWQEQIIAGLKVRPTYNPSFVGLGGEMLIRLEDGSYTVIENRASDLSINPQTYSGCPLARFFPEAELYRMLMAGDFATGFVAKNLIALVSIGNPQTEGDNYQRPDQETLTKILAPLENSNQAQYIAAEQTYDIRYITPNPECQKQDKYKMVLEALKNILPSPFWFNDGGGSFAASSTEMKALREEVDVCNDKFDRLFWQMVYERAAGEPNAPRIADKHIKPPSHNKSSLIEDAARLANRQALFADGGLSIRTVIEESGYDFDSERQRLIDQKNDVHNHIFIPSFEAKQGIVSGVLYDVGNAGKEAFPAGDPAAAASATDGPPQGGRPPVVGGRPQPESSGARAPRPSEA